ncbi:MAG: TRAP transporter large permease [Clostridiales bacterium]|nr:TRAP transporter large permease [Clostridiales bacterium]
MSSGIVIGIIGIIILIGLIFAGVNIGIALMAVGFFGYAIVVNSKAAISVLCTVPAAQASSYSMMVVPLFILMGNFAYRARMSEGLYDCCKKWLNRIPGNLACATIVACAGFGAICGSTPATCATMGTIALPEMRKEGYDDKLSTGSVGVGGTLGILIPPSTPMILYAVLTSCSVGAMFAAGVLPGIVLALLCVFTVVFLCKTHEGYAPPTKKVTWKDRFLSLKGLIRVVILFGVVLGGMFTGWFSVAQCSAVGAFLALILMIPGGTFNWKTIVDGLKECVRTFSMTFLIIIGASVFSSFLTVTNIPMTLASSIGGLNVSKYLILVLITLVYLALGMIMDALPMMMLTVPIFYPVIMELGFSPIWFGIYNVLLMCLCSITPPVGICCFVIKGMNKDLSLGTIYRGCLPFIITIFVMIVLLAAIPQIATIIPHLLGMI